MNILKAMIMMAAMSLAACISDPVPVGLDERASQLKRRCRCGL